MMLKLMFEKLNFAVDTAINGFEAYKRVNESFFENSVLYDLVVLDLNMPIMDGYKACEKIKDMYKNPIKH
jgi:CheY-like chemotaxis protein